VTHESSLSLASGPILKPEVDPLGIEAEKFEILPAISSPATLSFVP
jgi:hypothetical protein